MRVTSSYGGQRTRAGVRRTGRRRSSVGTRARFQRPSAYNQRSQIRALARQTAYNTRMLRSTIVHSDWYRSSVANISNSEFLGETLTSMDDLTAVNRQSVDVFTSQTVVVRNMIFEWACTHGSVDTPAEWTLFICTPRPNNADYTVGNPALTAVTDYADMGGGNAVIINSGQFKVLYMQHFRTFPLVSNGVASGNPNTSYRKGKVNLKLGFKIRSPTSTSWKDLTDTDLPTHQRLYFFYRNKNGSTPGGAGNATLQWSSFFTMISQD